jgi:reverse gyrase
MEVCAGGFGAVRRIRDGNLTKGDGTMNIDAQAVIKHLSEQVAKLSVDVAIKDAQIEALQKQAAESTEKEGE